MSTQPSPARFIVPIVAFTLAAIVLGVVFTGGGPSPTPPAAPDAPAAVENAEVDGAAESGDQGSEAAPPADDGDPGVADGAIASPSAAEDGDEPGSGPDGATAPPADEADAPPADAGGEAEAAADPDADPDAGPAAPAEVPVGLRAVAPADPAGPPTSVGSLDPTDPAGMRIDFTLNGAGITRIAFADIWETAEARRQAAAYQAAGGPSQGQVEPPDESLRYVLAQARVLRNSRFGTAGTTIPELAASQLIVDGAAISLLRTDAELEQGLEPVWSEMAPGRFETVIVDAEGEALLRVERTYELAGNYDVRLRQRLISLVDRPLDVRWWQFGPGDLRVDRARYMDRRRYRFGVGVAASGGGLVLQAPSGSGGLIEHQSLEKREEARVWPSAAAQERSWDLSWFAVTNRYFGFAVHPPIGTDVTGPLTLEDRVEQIIHEKSFAPARAGERARVEEIFVYLASPMRTVPAGETLELDLGVFAGPLDRDVLTEDERYTTLRMDGLILYQMSAFCAICTFQWLARLLLAFLDVLHDNVLFDWGLAIIVLVLVVRTLLHPITKKSQVGMQRFGKAMQAMRPEMEKLQKKYKDDPKRMQMEQVRLMREHGVSPMQALGCLPMFLQTPIWIALYAMLYFAFDLRQEAAFFGAFQHLTGGAWSFLADLSSGDHFFFELEEPRRFLFFNITGGNLLPLLLGAVFYFQQKYMTPPSATALSPEQKQQQAIMKFMMVVLFPIMLYSAPSGLVLYIITSSLIGIFESKYIRRHVEAMDSKREADGGGDEAAPRKERASVQALMGGRRKPKDAQARAYTEALEARRKKIQDKRSARSSKPRGSKKRR